MKKLSKIRALKYAAQGGRCFYCRQPMWHGNQAGFVEKFGLPCHKAHYLKVTAEHLLARCEGGGDTPENIVAACWFCNTHRHHSKRPLAPDDYARKVRSRLSRGRWHGLILAAGGDLAKPALPVTPAKVGA
ncbi:MAG: HNH endonuclease [Sphingomonadales bacterium]|nr:HNH endonuclease [Sphingomonadales bacterium]